MKKLGTLIILLAFLMIGIPICTMANEEKEINADFSTGGKKSIACVYNAMRQKGHVWLTTSILSKSEWVAPWGWEDNSDINDAYLSGVPGEAAPALVWSQGGVCFGHMTEAANKLNRKIDNILTIDLDSKSDLQYLAWHIAKATVDKQQGSLSAVANVGGKAGIVSWLRERGYKYNVICRTRGYKRIRHKLDIL